MRNRTALILSGLALLVGLVYVFWPSKSYCVSAYKAYGFKVWKCPTGEPRQLLTLEASGLARNGDGEVVVSVRANYTEAKADGIQQVPITKFKVQLFIVNAAGVETALPNQGKWRSEYETKIASIKLPLVDDGDYLLRAKVSTKIGKEVIDLKLPLYAPAKIHVLTDRPLYEPGNSVQFRALALRSRDLSPIDNRPGTWLVRSPSGVVLLEESAPAGEWGVVAGDFPLADDAEEGSWSVSWRSGDTESSSNFDVRPFVLPRFRVEATPDKSFYQAGQAPTLSGAVTYSSGAPVANAEIEIRWRANGAWPPPREWTEGEALPQTAKTGAEGRFTLKLPEVPADLIGRNVLVAYIAAVDPAGDRVASSASILLSEDAISVSAVTELNGGLVANSNNRVYLRVTDPVGTPLAGHSIKVTRAWAAQDEGVDALLDADGVARIQLDPGRPATVVLPLIPVRAQAVGEGLGVSVGNVRDLILGADVPLRDSIAIEKWPLASCQSWVGGDDEAEVGMMFRVSSAGAITATTHEAGLVAECLAAVIKRQRLPAGRDRLYSLTIEVPGVDGPELAGNIDSDVEFPDELEEIIETGAMVSRRCLPTLEDDMSLPWVLFFQIQEKSKKVTFSWLKKTESEDRMPAGLGDCIVGGLRGVALSEEAESNAIGVVEYEYSPGLGETTESQEPQATTIQGYALAVSATQEDKEVGTTKFHLMPGAIPNLRLRATPVMAKPGETIELAFFRGPDYEGSLPREIAWSHEGDNEVIKLEDKKNSGSYVMPKDAKGWYRFYASGAQALVFVRSEEDLSVSLSTDSQSYAPGAMATLAVKTKVGGQGAQAAVGLFGVDNSLSQIATLRGPDDLGSLRSPIVMQSKAFGALDAQALTLGRIRGVNAAEATILRVASIPSPEQIDVLLNASAETQFDPIAEMTDHFYVVLAELHRQTRVWEKSAAKGETMTPKLMSTLWTQALKACEARGEDVTDAYKRPLRLHWLPSDLLELTSPAQVVADATRLSEDVENWPEWVSRERP